MNDAILSCKNFGNKSFQSSPLSFTFFSVWIRVNVRLNKLVAKWAEMKVSPSFLICYTTDAGLLARNIYTIFMEENVKYFSGNSHSNSSFSCISILILCFRYNFLKRVDSMRSLLISKKALPRTMIIGMLSDIGVHDDALRMRITILTMVKVFAHQTVQARTAEIENLLEGFAKVSIECRINYRIEKAVRISEP